MKQNNVNEIIYSASISKKIQDAYNNWQLFTNKPSAYEIEANAAFLYFVELCEKENKHINHVIEVLNS